MTDRLRTTVPMIGGATSDVDTLYVNLASVSNHQRNGSGAGIADGSSES